MQSSATSEKWRERTPGQGPPPDNTVDADIAARVATQRARVNAHKSWAKTKDRPARTAPARAAFLARFEREVDPEGLLLPYERAIRAEHALRAHMGELALKSAEARRRTAHDV